MESDSTGYFPFEESEIYLLPRKDSPFKELRVGRLDIGGTLPRSIKRYHAPFVSGCREWGLVDEVIREVGRRALKILSEAEEGESISELFWVNYGERSFFFIGHQGGEGEGSELIVIFLDNELGYGAEKTVFLGLSFFSGKSYAVYRYRKKDYREVVASSLVPEVKFFPKYYSHMELDCPWGGEMLFSIYERANLGDLFRFFRIYRNQLTLVQRLDICFQIFSSIHALHKKNLAHNDLKPENFLVSYKGRIVIKLGDFSTVDSQEKVHMDWGSPIFKAPEQYTGTMTDPKAADVFAATVTCYEVLSLSVYLPHGCELLKGENRPHIMEAGFKICHMVDYLEPSRKEYISHLLWEGSRVHYEDRPSALSMKRRFKALRNIYANQ